MGAILTHGFLTGLVLQIAIGPVFFFILNIALQRTIIDGMFAVIAVTLVDYLFITLAILGVGKLLEKPKINVIVAVISSIALVIFGIVMIVSIDQTIMENGPHGMIDANYANSFLATFVLTISSPLTIVFWTSLFAAKAIEKGYQKEELVVFGIAAGMATLVFLGSAVACFTAVKAAIPFPFLRGSNLAVGALLIAYGMVRLLKSTGIRLPLGMQRRGETDHHRQ